MPVSWGELKYSSASLPVIRRLRRSSPSHAALPDVQPHVQPHAQPAEGGHVHPRQTVVDAVQRQGELLPPGPALDQAVQVGQAQGLFRPGVRRRRLDQRLFHLSLGVDEQTARHNHHQGNHRHGGGRRPDEQAGPLLISLRALPGRDRLSPALERLAGRSRAQGPATVGAEPGVLPQLVSAVSAFHFHHPSHFMSAKRRFPGSAPRRTAGPAPRRGDCTTQARRRRPQSPPASPAAGGHSPGPGRRWPRP